MDGSENYDGNWKSWVDDWKNYWHDGSGLHDLTVSGHCYFNSMRNSGDFSSQDYTLVHKDYCLALKRPHSSVQDIVAELEHMTLLKYMIHGLTVSTARS